MRLKSLVFGKTRSLKKLCFHAEASNNTLRDYIFIIHSHASQNSLVDSIWNRLLLS